MDSKKKKLSLQQQIDLLTNRVEKLEIRNGFDKESHILISEDEIEDFLQKGTDIFKIKYYT